MYFLFRIFSQMSELVNIFLLFQKLTVIYIKARIILGCAVERRLSDRRSSEMLIIQALLKIA